jgi:predicted Zn-ribbon and HTH transcriptional regulator
MENKIPIWDEVIEDMRKRDRLGHRRYNTRLHPFNGRKALQDAYEEALDLAVYLKQELIERELIATRCAQCGYSPCFSYYKCPTCQSCLCLEGECANEK